MSITVSNDSSHLTMEGSTKVTIKSSISIVGTHTELPIEIVGEFKDIPHHLHQIYMQSMMSSYGSVNVYDNTKDEIKIKEKWGLKRLLTSFIKK